MLALLIDPPRYQQSKVVVGTVMSNKGFQCWLEQRGYTLLRTSVGDKYVARKLKENNLLLGGEQSGHIILSDYLPTGDGIFTALRIMETISISNNPQMHTFNRFPQLLINIPIQQKKDLTEEPFATIIKESAHQLPQGRIVVRYSGTESLLRVMVENEDEQRAYIVGNQLATTLQKSLG